MSLIPLSLQEAFHSLSTVADATGACKQQVLHDEEWMLLPELSKSTKIVPNKIVFGSVWLPIR
jgi:hypothetical protein